MLLFTLWSQYKHSDTEQKYVQVVQLPIIWVKIHMIVNKQLKGSVELQVSIWEQVWKQHWCKSAHSAAHLLKDLIFRTLL